MNKSDLKLDWCSYQAAKYAVEKWHYSQSVPAGKSVHIGVWEKGCFIGTVLFSRGASNAIGKPYRVNQSEVVELTRVALTKHGSAVSRILTIAIRMLGKQSPALRLIVSYADPEHGHHGGIYQATNWVYAGRTSPDYVIIDKDGKRWHSRMVSKNGIKKCFGKYKTVIKPSDGKRVNIPGKYRYLYPLDDEMRKQIEPLRKPYPKRISGGSNLSDAPGDHPGEGGSIPTPPLQKTAQSEQ